MHTRNRTFDRTRRLPALAGLLALALLLVPQTAAFAQFGDWSHPPGIRVRPEPPPIRVEPPTVELGDVRPNTTTDGKVSIVNTSDEPLRLLAMRNTCSCTAEKVSGDVILPGESVQLTVSFDSKDYFGPVQRYVRLLFEGYAQPAQVMINANVNSGIRADLQYTPPTQHRIGHVQVTSVDNRPLRIVSVDQREPEFADEFDPARDDLRSDYRIRFDLSRYAPEQIPEYLVLELDDADSPIIQLRLINNEYIPPRVRPMWVVRDDRHVLEELQVGVTTELTFAMLGSFDDPLNAIESLDIESDRADVQLLGMVQDKQGLQLRFGITPRPSAQTLLHARITITALEYADTVTVLGRVSVESDDEPSS